MEVNGLTAAVPQTEGWGDWAKSKASAITESPVGDWVSRVSSGVANHPYIYGGGGAGALSVGALAHHYSLPGSTDSLAATPDLGFSEWLMSNAPAIREPVVNMASQLYSLAVTHPYVSAPAAGIASLATGALAYRSGKLPQLGLPKLGFGSKTPATQSAPPPPTTTTPPPTSTTTPTPTSTPTPSSPPTTTDLEKAKTDAEALVALRDTEIKDLKTKLSEHDDKTDEPTTEKKERSLAVPILATLAVSLIPEGFLGWYVYEKGKENKQKDQKIALLQSQIQPTGIG
jgi:hypothetical protein